MLQMLYSLYTVGSGGGLGGPLASLDVAVKRRIPMLLVIKLFKDLL